MITKSNISAKANEINWEAMDDEKAKSLKSLIGESLDLLLGNIETDSTIKDLKEVINAVKEIDPEVGILLEKVVKSNLWL